MRYTLIAILLVSLLILVEAFELCGRSYERHVRKRTAPKSIDWDRIRRERNLPHPNQIHHF